MLGDVGNSREDGFGEKVMWRLVQRDQRTQKRKATIAGYENKKN